MSDFTWADIAAFVCFTTCWAGYDALAHRMARRVPSLVDALKTYRASWMDRLCRRENHQADATILSNLLRYAIFFASTTVFILAGLVALLGTTDKVVEVVSRLPFSSGISVLVWEVKVVLLIYIFVYAFFKFTWCAWQYNATSILAGSAPGSGEDPEARARYVDAISRMVALAGDSFNHGVRAYYFSMAALSWFLHPWLLVATTLWVTAVVYRRDFHSDTLKALLIGIGPRAQT